MEYAYSVLMFIFGGVLFIYALIISTGETDLIARKYSAKIDNPKEYAKRFSKLLMLVSVSPFVSGIVGLIIKRNTIIPLLTLLIIFIVTIRIGIKKFKF